MKIKSFTARLRSKGFTLLEVMIAVTVFAAIAVTISETASQSVNSVLYLQDKTLASMVAENRMTEMRLQGLPAVGEKNDTVKFANREWHLNIKTTATDFPDTHMVIIAVADITHKDNSILQLTTIMGRH